MDGAAIDPATMARQRLVQSLMQPTQNANTGWGGLANAGSAVAGALTQKSIAQQMADPNYATDITRYGMTPQQIQRSADPGIGSAVSSWLGKTFGGGGS